MSAGLGGLRLGAACKSVFQLPYIFASLFCSMQSSHPAVPETAVIGYPHDIKGEGEHHGRSSFGLWPRCLSQHLCKRSRLRKMGSRVFMGEAVGFLLFQWNFG